MKDQYLPQTCLLIWCLLRIEGHLEDRIYIYIYVCVCQICQNLSQWLLSAFLIISTYSPPPILQPTKVSRPGAIPHPTSPVGLCLRPPISLPGRAAELRNKGDAPSWATDLLVSWFSQVRLPNYGPLFGNEASTTGGMALTFAWESIPIDDSLARPLGHSRMLECCEFWVTIYNLHRFAILISSYILKGGLL